MSPAPPRVDVISASAGSGKTYRLAEELKTALVDGSCRPEAVLATTFTKRAAAELEERARQHLIQVGSLSAARRLAAARIGTVNAVCGRLVLEFALELGLSPDVRVLDGPAADRAFHRAIHRVVTFSEAEELAELASRLTFEWLPVVSDIVQLARINDIGPDALDTSCQRSLEGLLALLDEPADESADAFDLDLESGLAEFLAGYDPAQDTTKRTRSFARICRRVQGRLGRGDFPEWADWRRLETEPIGMGSKAFGEALKGLAGRHLAHPRLRQDLENATRRVFEVAARALEAYTAYKDDWGVMDFTDQELLCLRLLRMPSVTERLAPQLDLVLVDEFQDTSPLQLAIFVRLAQLARRSVWVGDQKQSIYAFRGTDPALMDAAVEALAQDGSPETLSTSYRSRPGLVAMTSELFAVAFSRHDVSEDLVRLAPKLETDPADMGPALEWWSLKAKNVDEECRSLAEGVRQLLRAKDPVRDTLTGSLRGAEPADVAVLCRTNQQASRVSDALAALGIRAIHPRAGVLSSPEGRLALASLTLWADPWDRVAQATVARLADYPGDGDAWIEAATRTGTASGFGEAPSVSRVTEARRRWVQAGALDAFDRAVEAAGVADRCRDWGDPARRLANLNAVRAAIVAFAEDAGSDFAAAPAGAVAHLQRLADQEMDKESEASGRDAVSVGTWHGAKGLEWPVTVLFDLDRRWTETVLGVSVGKDRAKFDLSEPLAGRWIRCWLNPYHPMMTKGRFFDRLGEGAYAAQAQMDAAYQDLRLLYVAWTRARDRLVLACRGNGHNGGILGLLGDDDGPWLKPPTGGGNVEWLSGTYSCRVRELAPGDGEAVPPVPAERALGEGPGGHPPAVIFGSDLRAVGESRIAARLGPRLRVNGQPDMEALGMAVHGFLAADTSDLPTTARIARAALLLERWGVADAVSADDVAAAGSRLRAWIAANWPSAAWHREWPVAYRVAAGDDAPPGAGTIVAGVADLALETATGFVLIDHKTFPGDEAAALQRAAGYAGQLMAYRTAIERAVDGSVLESFIHLPILGIAVAVRPAPFESGESA